MSRHRNVRKINLNDERDDDESYSFGRSIEDEMPMSPGTAKFIYKRLTSSSAIESKLVEEEPHTLYEADDTYENDANENGRMQQAPMFDIDDDSSIERAENMSENESVQNLAVEQLRLLDCVSPSNSKSPSRKVFKHQLQVIMKPSSSSQRLAFMAQCANSPNLRTREPRQRCTPLKSLINLVVVGHVDAGKSTLMGHLLFLLGKVDNRVFHRNEQEARRSGKASFVYAWLLDETSEERQRGASQADAGLLVVNATRGEFETGFDQGGQTREHVFLIRSFGVTQLAVAVNKLDTIDWSECRYHEIIDSLSGFLQKQASFIGVKFVPVSGLEGVNLNEKPPKDHPLSRWYDGPTLIDVIDKFSPPDPADDRPLRFVISDVFKGVTSGLSVSGKVESGSIQIGDKVLIVPNGDLAHVKSVQSDDCPSENISFSGDQCTVSFVEKLEPTALSCGHVLCHPDRQPLFPASRFLVRLVLLNVPVPLTKGYRAELHAHSVCEPVIIVRLVTALDKATGRMGIVELETQRMVCLEPYSDCKRLGRLTLRANGQSIAAGVVEKVL